MAPRHTYLPSPTPAPITPLPSKPAPSTAAHSAPHTPKPSPKPTGPACATGANHSTTSTLTVCPAAAKVGDSVTITATGTCGAKNVQWLTLVFLGPKSYVGSGGGGNEVPITATPTGFSAHFTMPATYTGASTSGPSQQYPVGPGGRYVFTTYPTGLCSVPITIQQATPVGVPGANAPWTARNLIITPASLGAVRNGMSVAQAQRAAEVPFPGSGDGAYYPIFSAAHAPHLYLRPGGSSNFPACIGALGDGKGTPVVRTAEGFPLGGTVTELKALYGRRLEYVPMPSGGGLAPRAGYVLVEPSGTLVFAVDPAAGADPRITEIAGSTRPLTPSGCPG